MTPTLAGRIQTRIALVVTLGAVWTLLITLVIPRGDASLGDAYEATFSALLLVILLGLGWELLYHGLQQYRWEKDWPTLFGLLTGINEGLLIFVVLQAGFPVDVGNLNVVGFALHFSTTWVLIWLFANGPAQIISPRWRFRGGRVF